ncbi:MAG: hypothetical protein VYD64_02360 [Pseudomonadota bacterium]|nr:hypothetical protein [Pseudomonadota bacterium]
MAGRFVDFRIARALAHATAAAATLAGCASGPPVQLVDPAGALRARVDPALVQPADGPVAVPDRALTRGETRSLWNADRSRLRVCVATQAALV